MIRIVTPQSSYADRPISDRVAKKLAELRQQARQNIMPTILPLPVVALHKAVPDPQFKEASPLVLPGNHQVDCRVHIVGSIKKGEPYEQKVVAKVSPWALLARAMNKLNNATIESLVQESLSVDDAEAEAIKDAATEAIERLKAATKTTLTGKITTILNYTLMS